MQLKKKGGRSKNEAGRSPIDRYQNPICATARQWQIHEFRSRICVVSDWGGIGVSVMRIMQCSILHAKKVPSGFCAEPRRRLK